MSDWIVLSDPVSGRTYYANRKTNETSWTAPYDNTYIHNPLNNERLHDIQREAILNSASMIHFDAVWDTDEVSEGGDSWSDTDDSSSDDGFDDHKEQKLQNTLNHNEDIIIKHSLHTYWNIGQYEGHKYPFCIYADKHFNKMGKSAINLFKYEQYKDVKHALIKINLNIDKEAQQIWKHINSFMGLKQSTKDSYHHIHQILFIALKGSQDLKDEIFCQILKQIHCSPSVNALVKGWELISICCSTFPPSHELATYLAAFLFNNTKQSGVIGLYAVFSLKALDKTMVCGQRNTQPMDIEIQRIQQREPMEIKVYLADDIFRNILVYSQTTINEVLSVLMEVLDIKYMDSFGLFEVEQIRNRNKWIYCNELSMNERILDVFTKWSKHQKEDKKMRFEFKCKLFSKEQEETYTLNEWKIAYLTSVWNVKYGLYRLEEDEVYHLAAMQLQYEYGMKDDSFYASKVLEDIILRFIPYFMRETQSSIESVHKIMNKHGLYNHLDQNELHQVYIDYLRTSSVSVYFGSQFFECKNTMDVRNDVLLGISEHGFVFMDPKTSEISDRYKMEEILSYEFTEHLFVFVIGTLTTQRKYEFETRFGENMYNILKQYMEITIKTYETKGKTPDKAILTNKETSDIINIETSKETANETTTVQSEENHVYNKEEDHIIHLYPTPKVTDSNDPYILKRNLTYSSEGLPNVILDDVLDDVSYDVPHDLMDLLNHSHVIPHYKEEKEQQFMWVNSALCSSSDDEDQDDNDDEGWIHPNDQLIHQQQMDKDLLSEIEAIIDHDIMTQCATDNNKQNQQKSNGKTDNNSSSSNNNGDYSNHNGSNDNNDNNNNNSYNYNNNGNGGRDDNNDDRNKKHFNMNDDEDEEEDEKEEKEEDEPGLNKNAKEFIPNYGRKQIKKSTLKTIDEKQTFPEYSRNKSSKMNRYKRQRQCVIHSSYDPLPQYRAKYQMDIPREFTAKIADKIQENFKSVYVFMDKSLSLQMGQSMFSEDRIQIINYGFHDKQTNELLYCVVVLPINGGKWSMIQRLFTAKEIEKTYNIPYSQLPKTVRSLSFKSGILNHANIIKNKMMNSKEMQRMIHSTQWHKVTVFNGNDNKKRMILKLDKLEFMKHLRRFVNTTNKDDIKLIPIMMFDGNKPNINYCKYQIEYVWIVRIENDIDIGISFILNTDNDSWMVSGIHLQKKLIINQHQLAVPHRIDSCHCLDGFISNITHLKIGNPDDDLNRIKDLTKKFKTLSQDLVIKDRELNNTKKALKEVQMENEKLKAMMEVSQQSIHSAQSTPELNTNSVGSSVSLSQPSYSSSMIIPSSVPNLSVLNNGHIPVIIKQPLFYQYQMSNGSVMLIPNQVNQ